MSIDLTIRPSIGAGVTVNVLAGTDLEYLSYAAMLRIEGNAGSGAAATDLTHQLRYTPADGTPRNPLPSSTLPLGSTTDVIKADEDRISPGMGIPAGSKLVHSVVNAAAAARTPIFRYRVDP